MLGGKDMSDIEKHEGFKRTFKNNKLTLGLSVPFDNKQQNNIDFDAQVRLAQKAESLGFTSLSVRDNPLYSPHLGKVTTNYDPFVFLTYLSAFTSKIALGTGSTVATLLNQQPHLILFPINVYYSVWLPVIVLSNSLHLK